jgi:hypothetical protein
MNPLARSFVRWRWSGPRGGSTLKLLLCLWPSIACAADGAPPGAAIVNPLATRSLEQLSATLTRPLFAASRRKAAPNPTSIAPPREEPPDPPRPAPNVTLVGIISDPNGSQAVLRSGGSAKDIKMRVGDKLDGWKVTDIGKQNLTLALDDRTVSIVLFAEKPRPGQDANPKLRNHAAN